MAVSLVLCSCGESGDDNEPETSRPALDGPQLIKIERAAQVGDRFHFEGEGRSRQEVEIRMGGQPRSDGKSEDFTAKLLADVEVLAINENSKPSKVTVLVKLLTRSDEGAAPVVLLEDTVVDAANEPGGVVYSIAGMAVDQNIQQAIKLFTLLNSNSSRADEDAIFGTNESHAPGDEWPVNQAAIAEFFSEDTGMELVPESIKGAMKFEKIDDVGGVPCQMLSGQVSMEMYSFPGVPEGATMTDSTVAVLLSGAFPADTSLPVAEKSMTMKMAPSVAYQTNGIAVEMKMMIERTVVSKKTPKK